MNFDQQKDLIDNLRASMGRDTLPCEGECGARVDVDDLGRTWGVILCGECRQPCAICTEPLMGEQNVHVVCESAAVFDAMYDAVPHWAAVGGVL